MRPKRTRASAEPSGHHTRSNTKMLKILALSKPKCQTTNPKPKAKAKLATSDDDHIQLVDLFLNPGLLDTLLTFLDADALNALCVALDSNAQSIEVLQDGKFWQRLLQKLLVNASVKTTTSLKALRATRSNGLEQPNLLISDTKLYEIKHACQHLVDFLNLYSQQSTFKTKVVVIKGDLGLIEEVNGQNVDCLAFPTSASLRNPGIGVAGVAHTRASDQLDRHIAQRFTRATIHHAGDVEVTPGFSAGVEYLIHCIGPAGNAPTSHELLYKVYVNALRAIKKNGIKCAAFASISTGLLRFPIDQAAHIAMNALRDVMLRTRWDTTVVFVCLDPQVYTQFTLAKHELQHHFDANWFQFPRVLSPTTAI